MTVDKLIDIAAIVIMTAVFILSYIRLCKSVESSVTRSSVNLAHVIMYHQLLGTLSMSLELWINNAISNDPLSGLANYPDVKRSTIAILRKNISTVQKLVDSGEIKEAVNYCDSNYPLQSAMIIECCKRAITMKVELADDLLV